VLKAPQAGKVLTMTGTVGGSSNGTSSSTGTTSGSTSSSSTGSASSGSSSSGFITIANLSKMGVTTNIAEADAAGVKVGQIATVTFSATSTTVSAHVVGVSPQSTTTNNVVLYPVKIALDGARPGAKVGETASVSITTGEAKNVLIVATSAITKLGSRSTVTLQKGGATSVVAVETGMVGTAGTEIKSGLSEGDVVVLASSSTGTTGGFPGAGLGGLGGGAGNSLGGAPR